ncbi:MAG: SIR2 family protein [Streptosporangiaceae bacterium]|jgi:tetratricopeptide (TPR) repeat protein
MAVVADELLVFAGAGVSLSMPAGLPVFNWLRNEILHQLKLDRYVPDLTDSDPRVSAKRKALWQVAAGLVPEPFMLELSRADIDVQSWLSEVLSAGRPNAAHRALAQLAEAGARVWTVNFDRLIEQASGNTLDVLAWPDDPSRGAQLMKPHGSAGGQLIVTAEQVLGGLDGRWLDHLAADIRGRTVVFVGYRGRDLDFHPVWDKVLSPAAAVVWFDKWSDGQMNEAAYKRQLLRQVNANGRLTLAPPAPFPAGTLPSAEPNPSWDFIAWCQDQHLINVDPDLIQQLFQEPPPVEYPALPGSTVWARPAIRGLLGDYAGARNSYLVAALRPGYQRKAVSALATSFVNHGGNAMSVLLAPAVLLPESGRLATVREIAERKRLTAWSRTGRHEAVLRATEALPPGTLSTYLILRAEALRMTGSLTEAAETARIARERARTERHPVRTAHAAFQECLALLWAERLKQAHACLDEYLRPYAELAATRWVAWADFIAGGLAVHDGDADTALENYQAAETRFLAEVLLDGVVSVKTARLAAYRLLGDSAAYSKELTQVIEFSRSGNHGQRYYTRRNAFTAESIDNDHAEFIRCSRHDLTAAWNLYERTAASRYPLQACLGHLGLALIQAERGHVPSHATTAARIAGEIGCQLTTARSRELLDQPRHPGTWRQIFFC